MSDWHRNLPPEKAAEAMAFAEKVRAHFHICHGCRQPFTGEITWDCPVGSPILLNLCPACAPLPGR